MNDQSRSQTDGSTKSATTLAEIEILVERAREGEISEHSALSRIAVLARHANGGEIYQKPWG